MLKTVQELIGRQSIEMTLRYSHHSPDHKKKAVSILERNLVPNRSQAPKVDTISDIDDIANSLKDIVVVH